MEANGLPRKIVIDKSAANTAGLREIKRMLKRSAAQFRSRWCGSTT